MKKIMILKIASSLFLGLSLQTMCASSVDQAIADLIGTDLASLQKLTGDISNISQLNYSLTSENTLEGFDFNFFQGLQQSIAYVFPFTAINSAQMALNNTPYATFDWSPVVEAINNDGVYITLLAFDQNNTYIDSILCPSNSNCTNNTNVQSFAVAIYDNNGQIFKGMPLIFPATNNAPSNSTWSQSVNYVEFALLIFNSQTLQQQIIPQYPYMTQNPFIPQYPFLLNLKIHNPLVQALKLIKAVSDLENNPVTRTLELVQAVANNEIISQVGTNLDDLQNLTGDISSITHLTYSLSNVSAMPGFNFNFQDSIGYTNYTFIAPSPDSGASFTALHNTSYNNFDWSIVLQTINNGGAYLTLLAFDENNQLIRSVINSENNNFNKLVLAVYDDTGAMINGMPLVFPAGNANQSGGYQAIEDILFALYSGGNILTDIAITNYPFLLALNIISPNAVANVLELAQAVFEFNYPAPMTNGISDATVVLSSGQILNLFNYEGQTVFNGVSVRVPITPSLSSSFLNSINANLATESDVVWVNLTNDGTTIQAIAYTTQQGYIDSTSMTVQDETIVNGFYYDVSQNLSDLKTIPVNPAKINNLWIKFVNTFSFTYYDLLKLTLSQLQGQIRSNQSSINSFLSLSETIPGWNSGANGSGWSLGLNQMNSGNGYAFIQDPWNNYITTIFSGTSGIAVNINVSSIETTMTCSTTTASGASCRSCNMVLLGFDQNNVYIPDIIATPPTTFGLFMYDANGNLLSGFPVQFSANNYVGLGNYQIKQGAQGPAQFTLSGFGLSSNVTLKYPFNLSINWESK